MVIRKSIQISDWNEEIRRKLVDFWQERNVVFSILEEDHLEGKRGSLWGNMVSFDMSRLISTLRVARVEPNRIECALEVNTIFQAITEWNFAYWQLEMDTLESWLVAGDKKQREWERLREVSRKASIKWLLSGGNYVGKRPPKE